MVGGYGTEVCTCLTVAPGVFPPVPPSPHTPPRPAEGSLPESQNLSSRRFLMAPAQVLVS